MTAAICACGRYWILLSGGECLVYVDPFGEDVSPMLCWRQESPSGLDVGRLPSPHGLGWDDARRSSLDCASAQILATYEDGDPAMDITIRRESQRLGSADTISVQNREMR